MTSDGGENSKHKMVFEKSGVDQRAPWLNVHRLPLMTTSNLGGQANCHSRLPKQ